MILMIADDVRNIFNRYIKQIFTALLFGKWFKISPLGDLTGGGMRLLFSLELPNASLSGK